MITIRVENFMNTDCCINYYNFNPCSTFENMTSFSPILIEELEQVKLMATLKVQKTRVGMFVVD